MCGRRSIALRRQSTCTTQPHPTTARRSTCSRQTSTSLGGAYAPRGRPRRLRCCWARFWTPGRGSFPPASSTGLEHWPTSWEPRSTVAHRRLLICVLALCTLLCPRQRLPLLPGAADVTDHSTEHDAAVTDRAILAGSAYNTGRHLSARQSIYQWQTPRYDLPGIVVERLRRTRGTVVDVGCGNGRFIERLRRDRPDLRLLGLDVALGILAGVPRPVAVADAAHLPLASAGVDGALALHMLYHVEDIPAAIKELARVVTPGGVVVASTNSARDKAELDRLWERSAAMCSVWRRGRQDFAECPLPTGAGIGPARRGVRQGRDDRATGNHRRAQSRAGHRAHEVVPRVGRSACGPVRGNGRAGPGDRDGAHREERRVRDRVSWRNARLYR